MFSGEEIAALCESLGVTHVVTVPDSTLGRWLDALTRHGATRVVPVCREGEAWAVAAGLYFGGATPIVLIQCTGLFESGDALRNVVHDWKLPIFSIIGYRSYLNQDTLPGDTCLVFTEPVLDAWKIPYRLITAPAQLPEIAAHFTACRETGTAGAALIAEGKSVSLRLSDALATLRASRRDDEVVITTMGTAREWMAMSAAGDGHPLDFVYVPSSMSQATSVGLGIALAQPERRVIVCNGDGSMLMNLGSLVTIAAAAPPNLVVLVFDNGVYEVTGAQPTPASLVGDGAQVDYLALARACGWHRAHRFTDLAVWQREHRALIEAAGPTFAVLHVPPVAGAPGPRSPGPAGARARAFIEALRRR